MYRYLFILVVKNYYFITHFSVLYTTADLLSSVFCYLLLFESMILKELLLYTTADLLSSSNNLLYLLNQQNTLYIKCELLTMLL